MRRLIDATLQQIVGLLSATAIVGAVVHHASAEPATAKIDVYPPVVHLNTSLDNQPVIVVATRDDGVTRDVTAEAKFSVVDGKLAQFEGTVLRGLADGKTEAAVAYAGQTTKIPVEVVNATTDRPVSFKLDVMPIFMRAGCNTGGCHGSARGQDGFRLSLFGYDPDGDHHRITRELGFRRINLAIPEESLLLEKATGTVTHTGGKRFDKDSPYYHTLLEWLRNGASADSGEVAHVTGIELFPPQVVLEGAGTTQQMIVRATYSDGTDRDVTNLAVFMSNNDNSATAEPTGRVTAANRGEAFVLARFDTYTVGSQVLVLPADLEYTPSNDAPANYIDELVDAKLRKLRILPSPRCDDTNFIRRATIDITGQLPTIDELNAFVADKSPDKRTKLVDELLKRKEFAEIWAMKWAELLMVRSTNQLSYKSMFLYWNWLNDQIARGVPIDQMVRELLSATGGTFTNPATNFYQVERDTLKTTENVAQVFMGIRIQCAQCHNHPFDRWTMNDYYSFAAFFSQIGRKEGEDYRESIIFDRGGGEVRHPVGNRVMAPKFLGAAAPDTKGHDRRELMAEWLTSPENPYFAVSVANRIWEHYFGLGIVDPVDDVRVSNPPSNPELLAALGKKLIEYDYDFRRLVRDICTSNAYQRSTQANPSNQSDDRNFARAKIRRIRAEILLDCISQVTETKDKFRGLPLGARAVQIADGATTNYFLTTFGRSPRESVCACDVHTDPTLSQALHLLNGQTSADKIRQGGVVKRLLDEGQTPPQVIEQLYLRCLSRKPNEQEIGQLTELIAKGKTPQDALEDLFWALLNSREFVFNH